MDEVLYWVCTKRAPCLMTYDKQTQKDISQACLTSKSDSAINCDNPPAKRKKKTKRKLTILDETSDTTEKHKNVYFEVPTNAAENPVLHNTDTNIHRVCLKKVKPCPNSKRQKLQNGNDKKRIITVATSTPNPTKPPQVRRSPRVAKNKSKLHSETNNVNLVNSSVDNLPESTLALRPCKLNFCGAEGGDQTSAHMNQCFRTPAKIDDEDYSDVSGFTANYIRSTKVDPKKGEKKNLTATWRKVEKSDDQVIVSYNKSMNTTHRKSPHKEASLSSYNVVNVVTVPRASQSAMIIKPSYSPAHLTRKIANNDGASPLNYHSERVAPEQQVTPYPVTKRPVKHPITNTKPQHRCKCKISLPFGGSSSSVNFVAVPEEWNANTNVGVRTRSRGGLALQHKTPVDTSITSEESMSMVLNITSQKSKNTQTIDKKIDKKRKQKGKKKCQAACLKSDNPEQCCTCVSVKSPKGKISRKTSPKDKLQVPSCSRCFAKDASKEPNSESPSLLGDDDKNSIKNSSSMAFCIHIDAKSPGRKCCLPSGTYVNRESPERKKKEHTLTSENVSGREQLIYSASNFEASSPEKGCMDQNQCDKHKCCCLERSALQSQLSCSACLQVKGLDKSCVNNRRQSSPKKRLSSKRDSFRNKSGFAACFSDSGCSDCEQQHHSKKFFR